MNAKEHTSKTVSYKKKFIITTVLITIAIEFAKLISPNGIDKGDRLTGAQNSGLTRRLYIYMYKFYYTIYNA